MTRKILIVALTASVLIHGFLFWKERKRIRKASAATYSYLSNAQYKEQTNIFRAYNSPCDLAFIGDSHIYKCHWSELLGVVACNRGIGSDNTEGVYNRINDILVARPKVCFVSAGSNDIDLNTHPDTTLIYFERIVRKLKEAGIRPVVMDITSVAPGYPNAAFNEKAAELNKKLRGIAETISITVDPEDLQEDGIHLTASGYFKWKVAITGFLQTPALAPVRTPK